MISFFENRQRQLMLVASLYVVLLVIFHWQLPSIHVWVIAAFFSIAMNLTYVTEAVYRREYFILEVMVAISLIIGSLLGVLLSPVFVIAAIFGHGVWDIAKHQGMGIPFFTWYTLSCFAVDLTYSAALLIYWIY